MFMKVILFCYSKLFTTQSPLLMTLYKKPYENIVGKVENAGNQPFLLFPPCFQPSTISKTSLNFWVAFILLSVIALNLVGWLYWGLTPL